MVRLPMTNIVIWAPDDSKLLCRTLFNLVKHRPSGEFHVWIVTKQKADVDTVRMFTGSIAWTVLVLGPGKKPLAEYVDCFQSIRQDGRAIVSAGLYDAINRLAAERETNSLGILQRKYTSVRCTTLSLPAYLMDVLDSYGSNITKAVSDEAEKHPLQTELIEFAGHSGVQCGNLLTENEEAVFTTEATLMQNGESSISWDRWQTVSEVISNTRKEQ